MFIAPQRRKFSALSLLAALIFPSWALAGDFEVFAPTEFSFEVTEAGISAELSQNGCSSGYEAACNVVLQRSEYVSTHSNKHGDKVIYSWEMLVPQGFTYNASGGYLRAGRLLDGSGESLFSFILDSEAGYTVSRKACFGPEGFGKWHAIEVKVVWDSTKRKNLKDKTPGDIRVICDGSEVLSRSGRPNIIADEEVWFALGLAGSLKLADGDNTEVLFRNVSIETQ